MFARLATIMAVGRRHALPANARPGRPGHRIDPGRPHGRPNLVCRWRLDPASGRPVCGWSIDDALPEEPAGSILALRRLERNGVKGTARVAGVA
jgi:hypothetical protein